LSWSTTIDKNGYILEFSLKLGSGTSSGPLHVDTENEVEVRDSAVSGLCLHLLAINEDVNSSFWAIVDNLEWDPSFLHVLDKSLTASVPSHVTLFVVEHGSCSPVSLSALVSDGEERKVSSDLTGNEDLSRELGNIILSVGVSPSEVDSATRISLVT